MKQNFTQTKKFYVLDFICSRIKAQIAIIQSALTWNRKGFNSKHNSELKFSNICLIKYQGELWQSKNYFKWDCMEIQLQQSRQLDKVRTTVTSTICGNISWPRFRTLLISLLHTSNIFTYSVGPWIPTTLMCLRAYPWQVRDLITQEIRPVERPSD